MQGAARFKARVKQKATKIRQDSIKKGYRVAKRSSLSTCRATISPITQAVSMMNDGFVHGVVIMMMGVMHDALVNDALVRDGMMHRSVSSHRGHSHQCDDSRGNERKFHD
jgi:hypothetical protein